MAVKELTSDGVKVEPSQARLSWKSQPRHKEEERLAVSDWIELHRHADLDVLGILSNHDRDRSDD